MRAWCRAALFLALTCPQGQLFTDDKALSILMTCIIFYVLSKAGWKD